MFLAKPGLFVWGSHDSLCILSIEGAWMKAKGLTVVLCQGWGVGVTTEIRPRTQPPHADIGTTLWHLLKNSMTTWSTHLRDVFLLHHTHSFPTSCPPNTHPGPILKATLFTGHNHTPEKTSWLLQVCNFPAEAKPTSLNLSAKFMCPQMVLLTKRSDLQAL